MHDADVLDQRVADRGVVDQPLERLADLGLGEHRILLVQAEVVDRALGRGRRPDVLVGRQRGEILRREVARDVGVALLEQQALRRGFLHVAVDDARHLGLFAVVVVVALERDDLVGAPFAQLQRAGAGVIGLQPAVAEIAVLLLGHDQLLVDDGGHIRGQAVEHEGRRERLVGLDRQRQRAGLLDPILHVVLVETELGQDEGRRLVEQDGALQRKNDVLGGQRIAGRELQSGLELETEGLAVGRDRPGLGEIAIKPGRVADVEPDEAIVGVAHDLAGGDLERFGRVHRDDVVEGQRDHERVLRRGGDGRHGAGIASSAATAAAPSRPRRSGVRECFIGGSIRFGSMGSRRACRDGWVPWKCIPVRIPASIRRRRRCTLTLVGGIVNMAASRHRPWREAPPEKGRQ